MQYVIRRNLSEWLMRHDTNEFIQKFDVTCDTQGIIRMVVSTCDIHDLIVDTKEAHEIDDGSLTNLEMESYNAPMKKSFVENESKEAIHNESNNDKKFEAQSQDSQNYLSKMVVRPWEELMFNKN